jgi:hypothetical protein
MISGPSSLEHNDQQTSATRSNATEEENNEGESGSDTTRPTSTLEPVHLRQHILILSAMSNQAMFHT